MTSGRTPRVIDRRSLLRGAAASVALLAAGCTAIAAPKPTAPPRLLRFGGLSAEALPTDGTRPVQELEITEGLVAAGFVQGVNVDVDWRHADGHPERLPIWAEEFAREPVDLIIAAGPGAAEAAKKATRTVPIVMVGTADAAVGGVVDSNAHPGANLTGTSFSNTEEGKKRVELLAEAFPQIRRVVVIGIVPPDQGQVFDPERVPGLRRISVGFGMDFDAPVLQTVADLEQALEGARADDGIVIMGGALVFQQTTRLIRFTLEKRIPIVYSREDAVRQGGLMSYGTNRREIRLAAGAFVRKIVDGAKPGDLPILMGSTYDLAINVDTARRAGLSVNPDVLARAKVFP